MTVARQEVRIPLTFFDHYESNSSGPAGELVRRTKRSAVLSVSPMQVVDLYRGAELAATRFTEEHPVGAAARRALVILDPIVAALPTRRHLP